MVEYNEYYYDRAVSFAECPDYELVTQEKRTEILLFLRDYERKLDGIRGQADEDAEKLCRNYGYVPDSLSETDYFRVDTADPEEPFSNYTLCIFDREERTLYRMYYRQILQW